MLTQWFDPEPSFKGFNFARELVKLGHEVQILTGFPNYPGGKLYDGYSVKFIQRESMDGILVLRVPLYPSHDNSSLKRIVNYTSYAFSASLMGPILVNPADVMYVYHPPATIGLPAIALRLMRKIPFVYDIQDLWPDTIVTTGMLSNQIALRLVDKWCQVVYSLAAKIVVLSPGFKEVLSKRGVPSSKIEVIYNWCQENQIQPAARNEALARELGFTGHFNILFAGTMGKAQALDAVLEAANLVSDRLPSVQFVFIGGGIDVSRLKQRAQALNLKNVLFIPRRPVSEIGAILNLADVLLVHLKDDPLFRITIPSKTQAYMAVGRPILMGVKGDAAVLVEKAGAGLACNPENPDSIAEAVEKFAKMSPQELKKMAENGKQFYKKKLALSVGVRRFEEIFKSVLRET